MKLNSTLSIIATVLLAMITINVNARTIREEMTIDGIEKPHKIYNYSVNDSVDRAMRERGYQYGNSTWWSIPITDTIVHADPTSMCGLLADDFSKFYKDSPIGKIAPLKRRTAEYKDEFDRKNAVMTECRQRMIDHGVYMRANNFVWYHEHNYDMSTGCFILSLHGDHPTIVLNKTAHKNILELRREHGILDLDRLKITIMDDMQQYLKEEERVHRGGTHMEVDDNLIVPISNLDVAMLIEDCRTVPGEMSRDLAFDMIYKMRVAYPDDPKISYLELDDIFIVHAPTGQIVWSAKGGDQSQDFRLE